MAEKGGRKLPSREKGPFLNLREMLGAGLLAALTAVLGYVQIPLPFSPVPITGQTFGVMLAGSLLGARAGFCSMLLFLLTGLAGMPVFAGARAGIGVLAGPTGGFLLAFPLAAYVIGWLAATGRGVGLWSLILANLVGGVGIIYALGTAQLILVTGMDPVGALGVGALPFIPGDLVKVATAAVVARRVRVVLPAGVPGGSR